jgi:hypothetical protein
MQAQRAVPQVSVPRPDHAPVLVALSDRHPGPELPAGLIEKPRQHRGIALIEDPVTS